jgi:hypothetical protein
LGLRRANCGATRTRLFTRPLAAARTRWQRAAATMGGLLCALAAIAGPLIGSVLLFVLVFVSGSAMAAAARWLTHRARPPAE